MLSAYDQLLDATIQHLQELSRHGSRYVPVSKETLARLKTPVQPAPAIIPAARVMSRAPVSPPATSRISPAPLMAEAVPVAAAAPALDPAAKAAAFDQLRERAHACVKCTHLAGSRKNVVFGVGDIHSHLMFVGEAPGADEDAQGEPFVGAAGQLLTKIIQTMGFNREQVYIANILKCRPDMPPGSSGNRKPSPEELQTCIPFLHSQIDLIQPRVLVALGGVAMEGLLGKSGITKLRGQWQTYRGIPLMPTFHPSYLLRTLSPVDKRHVWEDMLAVLEKLGLAVSEKQRGFFLPRAQ
ncbi:MAG: uracil-DNA glycosylase [Verrucomicrobiota bacterium]|jgi:DNA polymerase